MKKNKKGEVEALSINNIIPNREQHRTIFKQDIQKIATSIKESCQIKPIIVRPINKDKYELITGQGKFEAMKYLGKKTIEAIIRDVSQDEGAEMALASILCQSSISSIDRENLVSKRWNSGQYNSYVELGYKIGKTPQRIGHLIDSKDIREKIESKYKSNVPFVSTEVLITIKSLTLPEKWKFCKLIEGGIILPSETREAVKFLKSCSEEEKKAVLSKDVTYRKAKNVKEERKPLIDHYFRQLQNQYEKKKLIQTSNRIYSADVFRKLINFLKEIEPDYYNQLINDIEKKQAVFDIQASICILTRLLYKIKILSKNKYFTISKSFGFSLDIVEQIKEDGHNYSLPQEWKTPEEIKLSGGR